MAYDFDTPVNRRDTECEKWNVGAQELPMWVADMDFRTAPEIIDALKQRVDHGVFGYAVVPDRWRQSYARWWRDRHQTTLRPEWLLFCTGVVPAISSIVRALTQPGDNVLIQTPVYNMFFNAIRDNGRTVLESPLVYEDGVYRIDFADLEAKLADPRTTMMFLCNPQNPAGIIWDKQTLARIGHLAAQQGVLVIADEIHCDITDPGYGYTPFVGISDECAQNCIMCVAPTKTFNLAGVQTSAVVIPNLHVRKRVARALATDCVANPNAFAITAACAAFDAGAPWLDELRAYLFRNKQMVIDFIDREIPQVRVVPSHATYLLWLDCSRLSHDSGDLARFIRERTGLFISLGRIYGDCGDDFLRMNIACPQAYLTDGLDRLRAGVNAYRSAHTRA